MDKEIIREINKILNKDRKKKRAGLEKIYVIHARTGCSCCMDDNHYRGPYKTNDDAMRRINYYKSANSEYWPLASQYARRGSYFVEELTIEPVSGGRFIIKGTTTVYGLDFIEVDECGKIANNDIEEFDEWNNMI